MNPLSTEHRHMLEHDSGIKPELIEARSYRTVTKKADLKRLGFSDQQCNVPALLIPIYGPAGEIVTYQARPDTPRVNKGKPVKYETPSGSSMRLDVPPSARGQLDDPNVPMFITEGIKKGDALVSHGLTAVALIGVWNFRGKNDKGGKTALAEWEYIALNGRRVYIVFDSDVMLKPEVHKALVRLKAFLESRGAKVVMIYLPANGDASKQGVDDYLAAGHSKDDLLKLATPELKAAPTEKDTASGPVDIIVPGRFMREITDDTLTALEQANTPPRLFMRSGKLSRLDTEAKIEALTTAALKGEMERAANYMKYNREGEPVPARPPGDVASDIMALPSLSFPKLNSIAHVPQVLPNSTILTKNGYDAVTGILLHLKGLGDVDADMPLDKALHLILYEVLGGFPFTDKGSKAHAVAMYLQPFVMPLITGATPMYLIDAPTRGTGKTLLYEAAAAIALDGKPYVMSYLSNGEEMDKRIIAMLHEGDTIIILDNVRAKLSSDKLAAVLTSRAYRGRWLGKSEMVTVANDATWIATGNNVEVSDEIARRIMPIRLDAHMESPETGRDFPQSDLLSYVARERTALVSACLSIVNSWIKAGMQRSDKRIGSFESWAEVMGGILEHIGIEGLLEGRDRFAAAADKETHEWRALTQAWYATFGQRAVTASEVFEDVIKPNNLLMDSWAGRKQLSALQRIGRALSSRRDRVFGGFTLRHAGQDSATKNAAYRLEPATGPNETPETPPTRHEHREEHKNATGVSETETPPKHPETPVNTPRENTVTDGDIDTSRVFQVFRPPTAEKRETGSIGTMDNSELWAELKHRLESGSWPIPHAGTLHDCMKRADSGDKAARRQVESYLSNPNVKEALVN